MTMTVKEAKSHLEQFRIDLANVIPSGTDDDTLLDVLLGLPAEWGEDTVKAAFDEIEGEPDEVEAEDKPADDVTDDQAAKANVSAANRKANAVKAAQLAVADKAFQTLLSETVAAGELVKRGPVLALAELLRLHGGDWKNVSKVCAFDDYPVVDSPWVGEQGNSDKYPTYSTSGKGKRITSEGSWWNDYADTMPDAAKAIEALAGITMAEKNDPKAPINYRTMGKTLRNSEKNTQTLRRNAVRATIKKAAKVRARMITIDRDFPAVKTGFLPDGKGGGIARTTAPLYISDATAPLNGETFGVTGYLGLNLVKAAQDGGSYDAVVTSTTKAPSAPTTVAKIEGVEMLEQYVAEVGAWLDDKANGAAFAKALAAKDSDDFVLTIGELFTALDSTKGRWITRYTKLKMASIEKAEKEAATG